MNLKINADWLLQMAEKEGNGIFSVGGLVTRVKAEAKASPALKPAEWSKLFPINAMRKLRFSLAKGVSDAAALLDFFGVPSPDAWQAMWNAVPVSYRQTQVFDAHDEAVSAWVREAEIVASGLTLADFDEALLRSSIEELRGLTRKRVEVALEEAQAICSRAGVALVLVPELPGTRISGCARWLSETHALVGLTLRYKTDDQLWFTCFHEIAHLLLHRDRQSFVIDNAAEDMGDEVIDSMMAKYEEEANRFAADTLIPPAELAKLTARKRDELTNDVIHDFAEFIGIGPGIVVGRLQHDKVLDSWQGNKLKQKLEWGFVTGE